MCNSYSSIWLEVGLPHHKKFLVGQTYREWQLPNQKDNTSLSVPQQLARWTVFLDQWEKALDTGMEVHLLGDLNINHCNWTQQSLPSSNLTSKLTSLITALFPKFSHMESLSVLRDLLATGLVRHHQDLITTTPTGQKSYHQ